MGAGAKGNRQFAAATSSAKASATAIPKAVPAISEPAPATLPRSPTIPTPGPVPVAAPAFRPYVFAPVTASGEAAKINSTLASEQARADAVFQALAQATTAAATTQASQIMAAGNASYHRLTGDVDQRVRVAQGVFTSARSNATLIAQTQSALARADAQAAITRLREDCERQRNEAVSGAMAEGSRMHASAKEQGVRILKSGTATRDKVHSHVGAALVSAKEIKDSGDSEAVQAALRDTSSSIRDRLTEQGLAAHDALVEKAGDNEEKIVGEARELFTDRDERLAEIEQGLASSGDEIVARIGQMHARQMFAIAQVEHEVLARFVELKSRAAELLRVSGDAARRVNDAAHAQVAALGTRRTRVGASLDQVAQVSLGKLKGLAPPQLKQASKLVQSELTKLASAQLDATSEDAAIGLTAISDSSPPVRRIARRTRPCVRRSA